MISHTPDPHELELPDRDPELPHGFCFGAATSSLQIEGGTREEGRGDSIWDVFARRPGTIEDASTPDVACDHFHRWPADIGLMSELGLDAYRMSVQWPRVIPDGSGAVNERGLDFYDRLIDGLLEAGIEPWVTLHHWELPQALEEAGGWPARDTAEHFRRFAEVVVGRLGDRVRHWITQNEPSVISGHGYGDGVHAPGRRSLAEELAAAHTILRAHGLAAQAIRGLRPEAAVSIALYLSPIYPATDRPDDIAAAERRHARQNRWFLDPLFGRGYPQELVEAFGADAPEVRDGDLADIAQPLDVLGVNMYRPQHVRHDPAANDVLQVSFAGAPGEHTSMGWPVLARGLRDLLVGVAREYEPASIAITENGSAWADPPPRAGRVADPQRTAYLRSHLHAVEQAIAQGAPVDAYFCWSLMDNWEWAKGYAQRFGIVHVDYETQERTIKDSGRWYAGLIASARARRMAAGTT